MKPQVHVPILYRTVPDTSSAQKSEIFLGASLSPHGIVSKSLQPNSNQKNFGFKLHWLKELTSVINNEKNLLDINVHSPTCKYFKYLLKWISAEPNNKVVKKDSLDIILTLQQQHQPPLHPMWPGLFWVKATTLAIQDS